MQGSKTLEGQLFYQISLNQLVPSDHLVRRLAKVLDLSWIRKATASAYSHTGRPSIDPVVIPTRRERAGIHSSIKKDIDIN
ncbi:MAG: hypothetical protein ACYSWP_16470 [Planctomycetota bacterium]